MSKIVCAGIAPHPPIIIPDVGKGELKKVDKTVKAMKTLAREVKESGPDTVVIIGPHGPVFQNGIAVMSQKTLEGSLAKFGVPQVRVRADNDQVLVKSIMEEAEKARIPVVELDEEQAKRYDISLELDHGALVPMYFLQEKVSLPFVYITMGLLNYSRLFSFGKALQEAAIKSSRRVAVIASGDLSHCLQRGSPAGYNPAGKEFDLKLKELLEGYRVDEVINLKSELVDNAAECGLRPIIMALGSLDGYKVKPEILSYEGPFGVGYLVAFFRTGEFGQGKEGDKKGREEKEAESPYVKLARETLEKYLKEGKTPDLKDLPENLKEKGGVFVSLKKKGALRGCIGTIEPARDSIAQEIVENALSAGLSDPRFPPVTEEELPLIEYSVDVLMPPEPVKDFQELDPEKYGVIVKCGSKTGLLLPKLEGVDTVEDQVSIAREKAGISPKEKYQLYRFEVKRYH